jgi:hypothetical protein
LPAVQRIAKASATFLAGALVLAGAVQWAAPAKAVAEAAPVAQVAGAVVPTCTATLTPTTGLPWRRGTCTSPGYTNVPIKAAPVLDAAATRVVRTLPGAMLNYDEYGEPIYFASSSTPLRRITCTVYACAGGGQARVDGAWRPARGSDGQLTVVDLAARMTYEFWRVERDADGTVKVRADGTVHASHMSVGNLDGRGNSTPAGGRLGITGAGVSRIFGVVTQADVSATLVDPAKGIRHALQLSLPGAKNCTSFRAPATKSDGHAVAGCVPEGARVQMDPSVNCATIRATVFTKAVCHALRTYGGYTMDNNGSDRIAIYGQTPSSVPTGSIGYRAAGVSWDYQGLSGLPIAQLRVLRSWDGS